jgi:tRNA A-37 threonylcarbamoyl transferase component Bud32
MNTIRICPVCGNPLPPDAPAGLCPVCLLKTDAGANPPAKGPSEEPTSTLTIGPGAFVRVHYFGDYELQQEIARGGMGVVWKARQASLNRIVALKMILAGKLAGAAEVQRFRREAEAAANLQHPNIVAIHEVGEHEGQHYYSMDYVEGRDLGARVRESGPLPPARAAECLQTIAEAVHFAHQRGTLHRDLKPQNVLMDAAGVPRITDFGLAKFIERDDSLTKTGATMGSPSYMPPEQAAGHLDQVGPHSDVYALGTIVYELLTGRPPFRAETAMATMRQVMESEPVAPRKLNPAVPPDLDTICLKCLEKNPARRYPSARALAEELGRFLKHEPIQAVRASAIRKAESWLRRHPWTLMAAASLVAMVLLGLLYWQYERVKFLENRPLAPNQALRHPGLGRQQLKTWHDDCFRVYIITVGAYLAFKQYQAKGLKQVSLRPTGYAPSLPLSQPLRVVCGLIGVVALGFTLLYFAKAIQVSVWENTPGFSDWLTIYINLYFSLTLLFLVVRDYQKFVHGLPSRTFSAEQLGPLHQAILDGDIPGAIKLYRRTVPDASLAEAQDYVGKHNAELRAKHPEKFAPPPKLWDLNWRWMGICLVVEVALFAGFWIMVPPVAPAARLFTSAGGFLSGAGIFLSRRLKTCWQRCLVVLGLLFIPLALTATLRFSNKGRFYFGGLVSGMCMIQSGFTRKRRKSAPGYRPLMTIAMARNAARLRSPPGAGCRADNAGQSDIAAGNRGRRPRAAAPLALGAKKPGRSAPARCSQKWPRPARPPPPPDASDRYRLSIPDCKSSAPPPVPAGSFCRPD